MHNSSNKLSSFVSRYFYKRYYVEAGVYLIVHSVKEPSYLFFLKTVSRFFLRMLI